MLPPLLSDHYLIEIRVPSKSPRRMEILGYRVKSFFFFNCFEYCFWNSIVPLVFKA